LSFLVPLPGIGDDDVREGGVDEETRGHVLRSIGTRPLPAAPAPPGLLLLL